MVSYDQIDKKVSISKYLYHIKFRVKREWRYRKHIFVFRFQTGINNSSLPQITMIKNRENKHPLKSTRFSSAQPTLNDDDKK